MMSTHLPVPQIPRLGKNRGKARVLPQCSRKETPAPGWAGAPLRAAPQAPPGLAPGLAPLDNFTIVDILVILLCKHMFLLRFWRTYWLFCSHPLRGHWTQ